MLALLLLASSALAELPLPLYPECGQPDRPDLCPADLNEAWNLISYVPDAWIDHSKTRVGYEIPLNRHFYRYEPPRELEEIEADIRVLEGEIVDLLREVTA